MTERTDPETLAALKEIGRRLQARLAKPEPKPKREPTGGDAMWRRLPGSFGSGKRR